MVKPSDELMREICKQHPEETFEQHHERLVHRQKHIRKQKFPFSTNDYLRIIAWLLVALCLLCAKSAFGQVDGLQIQDSSGLVIKQWAAGIVKIKCSAAMTCAFSSGTLTMSPTGVPGAKGDTGSTGATGTAATISLGTVATGVAGSNVLITNSGTSSAATFNFTIPRGDQGIQGIQGVKGDTGSAGAKGDPGTAGTVVNTKTAVAGQPLLSFDATAGTFTQAALTAANVGALPSTTVVPLAETGAAGEFLTTYNAGTGAFTHAAPTLPVTKAAVSGSPLLSYDSSTGAFTQGTLTAAQVGAAASNAATTVNGQTCTLGSTCTVGPTNYEVAADWSTTSTTFSNITGLGWSIAANATQTFICYLGVMDSTTTVGTVLGFTGPASPTAVTVRADLLLTTMTAPTTQAATAASWPTAIPTTACSTSCLVSFKPWIVTGIIKNGTNAGTVQLQGKVSSGTGKVQAASACWVH